MFGCISACLPYAILIVTVVVCRKLLQYATHSGRARELRQKAKKKRETEQQHIQKQIDILGPKMVQDEAENVLKLNGPELLEKYRSGNLKPRDVLNIYVYKACNVTKKLNCVTEIVKNCDETVEKLTGKDPKEFPLYGVPISLKESLLTKGAPTTMGLAKLIDDVAADDCVIAKVLKHCGAVPFVKTNFPQMLLSFESSNPIFGETSNPHNPDFCPGGSSSGEGSIIAAGGSVLGFGTDVGGSIRAPSHFCGICGFKPTTGRLSNLGSVGPFCMTTITHAVGPMARDVDTVVMVMRALCCDKMFELDPQVAPIKFREEMYSSKEPMRIGYFDDNGYVKPVPACRRVVKMAKEALEGAGHTLVPFTVPDTARIMHLASAAVFGDGGQTCMELLEDDIVDKRLMHPYKRWNMPSLVRKIYAAYLERKSKRLGKDLLAFGGGGDTSTYNCWKRRMEVEIYKAKFWDEWRDKYKIDALICPVNPIVACPKGSVENSSVSLPYTILFNAVNCPAGTVPVSKVTQKDIDDLDGYEGHYGDEWDEHLKTATLKSINMPIGLQCVSAPFKEEVCLRLMKEVETLLPVKKDQ